MTGFWEAILEERLTRGAEAEQVLLEHARCFRICHVSDTCPFDCIAITAPNPRAANAYLVELAHRIDETGCREILLLAVSDPEGVRVGSGGGTLNAILEIDEALRSIYVDKDPRAVGLMCSKVLLVHSGGDSQRSPTQCVCGKAWSALNSCSTKVDESGESEQSVRCNTPMDLLLDHLGRLFSSGLEPGSLVVTACDVMLLIPSVVAATADWSPCLNPAATGLEPSGSAAGLAIAADAAKYAPNHGVYCLGNTAEEQGKCSVRPVVRYLQKPPYQVAESAGAFLPSGDAAKDSKPEVAIDSGVVVFRGKLTEALAKLAGSETFRGCTSRGVSEGAPVLRLELYSDLLLALETADRHKEEGNDAMDAYLKSCGPLHPPGHPLTEARLEIWENLSGFPLGALLLKGATFVHLGTTPELLEMMTLRFPAFIEPYGLTPRAGCTIGPACSVEENPPAVVVNSKLDGAGVVTAGSVVEHCQLEGDGWEVGPDCLVSGVRSVPADYRLCLQGGMCLQQTDVTYQEEECEGEAEEEDENENEGEEEGEDENENEGEEEGEDENENEGEGEEEVEEIEEDGDEDIDEEEDDVKDDTESDNDSFVLSLFGIKDDIKAHYTAERARFCGAKWQTFLAYSGATVDDIWTDVPEADRKLWSAKLFPVHVGQEGDEVSPDSSLSPLEKVLWMQHVQHVEEETRVAMGDEETERARTAQTQAWLSSERLSFKDILRRANPAAEFRWRRSLETGMMEDVPFPAKSGVGAARRKSGDRWDVLVVITGSMEELRQAQAAAQPKGEGDSQRFSGAAETTFCVAPPWPSKPMEGMEWDGPLVLNALLVVIERYSALKRARFGSETSAAALGCMRILLCCGVDNIHTRVEGNAMPPLPEPSKGHVCVLLRNGEILAMEEDCVAALMRLCQSNLTRALDYQRGTYLGADNGVLAMEQAPKVSSPVEFLAAAANDAGVAAPQAFHADFTASSVPSMIGGAGSYSSQHGNTKVMEVIDRKSTDMDEGDGVHSADGSDANGASGATDPLEKRRDSACALIWSVEGELQELDERATDEACSVAGAAQALARIACRLYDLADKLGGGGHRSGPGANRDWKTAMMGLSVARRLPQGGWGPPAALPGAVARLRDMRGAWVGEASIFPAGQGGGSPNPQLVVRCARHYERASAMIVSAAVSTASLFIEPPLASWSIESHLEGSEMEGLEALEALPVGASVTSRAAARIDLAGGWTDTPPMSYEVGGSVLNAAVTISGERPVVVRCERIGEARVELVCLRHDEVVANSLSCTTLEDFSDFCVPQAPAALLKASLISAGIVSLPSCDVEAKGDTMPQPDCETEGSKDASSKDVVTTLKYQLRKVFGEGGIRITSRSGLPQGSGMGTSSILAGAVLSSACTAAGRPMSRTSLMHAVLKVEQLITSGGGHQDQVGGIVGGIKIIRTAPTLPLEVCPECIALEEEFEAELNDRLILVFTGKQRLARDLLQGVLRGWHDRLPAIVSSVKGLMSNAKEAAKACQGVGDLETLGKCLSTYWEQKKRMAPGAEPPQVKLLMEKLRPVCYGLSVCGAGGGGYVACITKSPGDKGMADVMGALGTADSVDEASDFMVHRGRLDPVGMEVVVDMSNVRST